MNFGISNVFWPECTTFALVLSTACSTGPSRPERPPGGAAGTAGAAASSGILIMPNASGWVDATENELGIQGAWYPYGDRYGAAKCLNLGRHSPEECSLVTEPPPPPEGTGFANAGGVMCTRGETAVILACPPGLMTSGCPADDFSNMWGAGIGFDFNANKGPPEGDGAKRTWNPADHGVTGISFEIDRVPGPKLRVEFPQLLTEAEAQAVMLPGGSNTDDHPDGAPYWGADTNFSSSPVVPRPGVNVIRWDQIRKPGSAPTYVFDPARLLGIQFHVPAVQSEPRGSYEFCVSKLTFLVD
jgi:hypothetical protein